MMRLQSLENCRAYPWQRQIRGSISQQVGSNVVKASSGVFSLRRWQFRVLPTLGHRLLLELQSSRVQRLEFGVLKGRERWVLGSMTAIALFWCNWRLLVATATGLGTMRLVYRLRQQHWQLPWADLGKFLEDFNHPLVLASLSGGVATCSTYLAVSIWRDFPSPWIATGVILQGLGTLSVLIFLVGSSLNRQSQQATEFEQRVMDLTATDPLKRLIAIRQLSRWLREANLDRTQQQSVGEYFQLLLRQEREPLVHRALLEGLQELQLRKPLQPAATTPFKPVSQRVSARLRQHSPRL